MKKNSVITVTTEDIRKFIRLEITYDEFKQGKPDADIECNAPYRITLDDINTALKSYKKKGMTDEDLVEKWFFPLWDELYLLIGIEDAFEKADEEGEAAEGFPTENSVLYDVWFMLTGKYENDWEECEISDCLEEIKVFYDNKDKPISKRILTSRQKDMFIASWNRKDLHDARKVIVNKYKEFIEDRCEEKDYDSLVFKAYATYGHGEYPYKQDWKESEKALLTLMEIAPDAQWANTLGYIYYYGRTNKGVPEYDKAFRYFSIGAAGYYYESRYKLADMFLHGYGIEKNIDITRSIIWELYRKTIKDMRRGVYFSNFSDVALRAGNLYRDGHQGYGYAPDEAFYYYLQAIFAINKRLEADKNYGDSTVKNGIMESIQKVLPDSRYSKRKATVKMGTLSGLLYNSLRRRHKLEMTVTETGTNEYSLKFRVLPFYDEFYEERKIFVTVPEAWYCDVRDSITVKVKTSKPLKIKKPVVFDDIIGGEFFNYGKRVANIEGEYIFKAPNKKLW